MAEYQKAKDIFIQRRNSNNQRFEEYALIVSPNSVIITDDDNDLITKPLSEFAELSQSLSSSYALTASYALNGGGSGNGTSGTSGFSGTSGTSGINGGTGTSGVNGLVELMVLQV